MDAAGRQQRLCCRRGVVECYPVPGGADMNNMNFFGWIRDGVRQSVLLGVSDAVEQLGTPAAIEDLHPSVAGFLKVDQQSSGTPKLAHSSTSSGTAPSNSKTRRRLGKSLKDIGTNAAQ